MKTEQQNVNKRRFKRLSRETDFCEGRAKRPEQTTTDQHLCRSSANAFFRGRLVRQHEQSSFYNGEFDPGSGR
ncbi:hypothetical protein, partial [Planococcus sp. YIM B11945]|uniref:hypothetical protein n=1 Tax=Planococcus sp. YIM B11945 TaxID=3435410 RepID=UPI003D7DD67C